ncbi:hypothetical protein DMB66_31285 [Actinoplanes sp. ATCC 53533]|uniref:DUF6461 domain-containing protein n=1 Tax=Actinoplanes sp. ATCC 53533 TaxID=1288362 RepID=UPI001002EE9A|nr:DUF6461 domain-containing protein [Actinoplanes sp. ATCC 53533]RSM57987.1 hypothetical protein DMB66_31285 [Actinoplanes sp. ATCC 53533]
MGDLAEAERLWDHLGEIACLTFVKGVDEAEALRRLGAYPDTIGEKDPDELLEEFESDNPQYGLAVGLGPWSVVIEPMGFCGADNTLLRAVSVGTEAVAVLRHDYASAAFAYAVDGELITDFEPSYPDPAVMRGVDPQRLWPAMRAVGFRPPDQDDEQTSQPTMAMALLLTQRITGVTVPPRPLDQPRLYAELEPWFAVTHHPRDLLTADRLSPERHAAPLVAAVEAADPATQRRVAVSEVHRQAVALGLAGTPGLDDALSAATAGTGSPITIDSPLGHRVRTWLAAARNASELDPGERQHAYALGWFTSALRGVLNPDPRAAALAAAKPLTSEIPGLSDHALRAQMIEALRA